MGRVGAGPRLVHHLRWLAVPAAVGVIVITALAVSTEDRQTFAARHTERTDQEAGGVPAPTGDGHPTGRPSIGTAADGANVEIGSDVGGIGISFTGDSVLAHPRIDGRVPADPVDLQPSDGADSTALRLTGSGRLEPVGPGPITRGEIVVEAAGGGVDVLRFDASRVEIRPNDAVAGGIEVTDVAAGGERLSIDAGGGGEIDLGDGLTLRVPIGEERLVIDTDPDAVQSADGASSPDGATDAPWRWAILALLALAALSAAAAASRRRRRRREEPFGPGFVGPEGVPADRFDEFVAMLAHDPDPARAIRLAFYAAERGMGDVPPRHSTETPFEWYGRVIEGRPHLAAPLRSLCDRFATARFAPQRPSPTDRDAAIAELIELHGLARGGGSVPIGRSGSVAAPGPGGTAGPRTGPTAAGRPR